MQSGRLQLSNWNTVALHIERGVSMREAEKHLLNSSEIYCAFFLHLQHLVFITGVHYSTAVSWFSSSSCHTSHFSESQNYYRLLSASFDSRIGNVASNKLNSSVILTSSVSLKVQAINTSFWIYSSFDFTEIKLPTISQGKFQQLQKPIPRSIHYHFCLSCFIRTEHGG